MRAVNSPTWSARVGDGLEHHVNTAIPPSSGLPIVWACPTPSLWGVNSTGSHW